MANMSDTWSRPLWVNTLGWSRHGMDAMSAAARRYSLAVLRIVRAP